jgi:hypothetical protein
MIPATQPRPRPDGALRARPRLGSGRPRRTDNRMAIPAWLTITSWIFISIGLGFGRGHRRRHIPARLPRAREDHGSRVAAHRALRWARSRCSCPVFEQPRCQPRPAGRSNNVSSFDAAVVFCSRRLGTSPLATCALGIVVQGQLCQTGQIAVVGARPANPDVRCRPGQSEFGRDALSHCAQKLPAGLFAAAARLLANLAVGMHHRVTPALVAATLTAGDAGLNRRPGDVGVVLCLAAQHGCRGGADVSADAAERRCVARRDSCLATWVWKRSFAMVCPDRSAVQTHADSEAVRAERRQSAVGGHARFGRGHHGA